MAKPRKPSKKSSIADAFWFKERFDKLERDHLAIIKLLKGGNVSDELAAQIRLARGQGVTIDRKVPDRQVPPKPRLKKE